MLVKQMKTRFVFNILLPNILQILPLLNFTFFLFTTKRKIDHENQLATYLICLFVYYRQE